LTKQRGFVFAPWMLYAILFVFVAAAGSAVVWKYNSAIEEAQVEKAAKKKLEGEKAELELTLKDQLADNMWLRVENTRVNGLLTAREAGRQAAAKERGDIRNAIDDVYRKNKDAREWGDLPVPRTVLDGLRIKSAETLSDKKPEGTAVKPGR
jgi:hypothetical protein